MTICDIRKMIRYPVWINEDPFCDRYESESEILKDDGLMLAEIVYITTDGNGEMTIEIEPEI